MGQSILQLSIDETRISITGPEQLMCTLELSLSGDFDLIVREFCIAIRM